MTFHASNGLTSIFSSATKNAAHLSRGVSSIFMTWFPLDVPMIAARSLMWRRSRWLPVQVAVDRDAVSQEHPNADLVWTVPGVLEVHKVLGSGSFGEVWQCEADGYSGLVAVKVFKDLHEVNYEHRARECHLLTLLQHPNLVKVFNVIYGTPSAILMEVCLGGTLAQLIHDLQQRAAFNSLSLSARIQGTVGVVACLEYLHASQVVHRDVKPSNLLLTSSCRPGLKFLPQVKLADFGLARSSSQHMSKGVGTLLYMAPEVMQGNEYSFPVDIYSFSMSLYEFLTGSKPYSGMPDLRRLPTFVQAVDSGVRPMLQHLQHVPEVCDILRECWSGECVRRPSARSLADSLRALAPSACEQA
mmetsp:Transcript_34131/g.90085  ORF Transcript_34131/g.90085 Transcript_34131/m.90085 type:complete len:358 (-) Transcript_34131:54-1127(-)